ncbi:MAG: DUF5989 family protein [Tepidisphaerales bacterium]
MMVGKDKNTSGEKDFLEMSRQRRPGLLSEMALFLWQNRNWWLLPIVVVLLALAAIVMLGGPGLAPLIYTVF